MVRIVVGEVSQIMEIFLVHGDDIVRFFIVFLRNEGGFSFGVRNVVHVQGPPGGRIDVMPNFFGGGGPGGDGDEVVS